MNPIRAMPVPNRSQVEGSGVADIPLLAALVADQPEGRRSEMLGSKDPKLPSLPVFKKAVNMRDWSFVTGKL